MDTTPRATVTTTPRVLMTLVALAGLAYGALAAWAALGTWRSIAEASPGDDLGLVDVGYVFAGIFGVVALVAAVGGVAGWRVARRDAGAGTAVLVVTLVLLLVPARFTLLTVLPG
jgi:hypothetical protein